MRKTILFISAALLSASLSAQNLSDLRISEIVVENTDGLVDDFGQRNGWIELFNNSNGTVKFGGCYLSDDKSDLKKYHIPSNDLSAKLGPRQSVVFYASGNAAQGTYYTNFTLKRGMTVYLVSNDGRTLIDELEIPVDLQADKSVMKIPSGVKSTDSRLASNTTPSPGAYNGDVDAKTNNQIMKEKDPHGWVLTLISVCTVFIALIILAFIFGWIGEASKKSMGVKTNKEKRKERKSIKSGTMSPEVAAAISMALSQEYGGETYAAIAMALDDFIGGGVHDIESLVLTIKPTSGSQWNEKTQNFRQSPR